MAQLIKQGNIFGRIGTGFGKGLAEQIPKEIERNRLSAGLQQFSQESANRSPLENLATLSAIPGVTPQMIQSFGSLAQQQARGQALVQQKQQEQQQERQSALNRFSGQPASPQQQQTQEAPSITQRKPLEEIQKGYIPPTLDERRQSAGERFRENPARYTHDPQMALDEVDKEVAINQERNAAYEQQHQRLTAAQDAAVGRLKAHSDKMGLKNVPSNIYNDIEDNFIEDILPKSAGGNGLTEQEAIKKRGKELENIDRDYAEVNSIGDWGVQTRKDSDTLRSLRALQKSFKKRGDTENFADTLVSKNGFSPSVAYSIAQPVSDNPDLNEILKEIKPYEERLPPKEEFNVDRVNKIISENNISHIKDKYFGIHPEKPEPGIYPEYDEGKELAQFKIVRKLANALGTEGSPLAVGYELKKLGYDPDVWNDYLIKNSDKLNLTGQQLRQLKKSNSYLGTKNDWWLEAFSGIDR